MHLCCSIFSRAFACLALIGILLATDASAATSRFKVVMASPVKTHYTNEDAIQVALAARMSVEIIRLTWSEKPEDAADLVMRIRAAEPDLVYTWGTVTTMAVAGAYDKVDPEKNITDKPIVFFSVAWPDQTKIVHSLERPGRNVTGVTHVVSVQDQMNTLLRWGPMKNSTIGTVYNEREPNQVVTVRDLQKWCDEQKVSLYAEPITPAWNEEIDSKNIREAVGRIAKKNVDWLYIGPDKLLALTYVNVLTGAALENRLPTFAATENPVRRSFALWGLYAAVENAATKAAEMIVAILNGSATPADIPVATARQNIVINYDTMSTLDFYPPTILRRAADIVRAQKSAAK